MTRVQNKERHSYLHTTVLLLLSLMLLSLPACSGFTVWTVSSSPSKPSGTPAPRGTLSPTVSATNSATTATTIASTGGGTGDGGNGGGSSTKSPTKTSTPTSTATWPRTLVAPHNKTLTCASCPSSPDISAMITKVVAVDPGHASIFITVTNLTTDSFKVVTDPYATLGSASAVAYFADYNNPLQSNGTATQPYEFSGVDTSPGKTYTFYLYLQRGGVWTYAYDSVTIRF